MKLAQIVAKKCQIMDMVREQFDIMCQLISVIESPVLFQK